MNHERLSKVLKGMKDLKISQVLVSDPASIFYLTGIWVHPQERMLALYLNLNGNHKLFINELFPIHKDLGIEIIWLNDTQDSIKILSSYINEAKPLGVDKNWPARFLIKLMELISGITLINSSEIIDKVRMSKDLREIELMKESSRVNDIALGKMIELIPQKYSERKMAKLLGGIYEELGAYAFSFDPVISYGANGADPHHEVDESIVKEGDSVLIDIGCIKNSYCSDMTRTVFYKYASDEDKKIYNIVLEANKRAIDIIKPGIKFSDIDASARNYIEAAGYGKYFTHRTGHSIGIDEHDFGDVSSVNTDIIKPGMIFSVEPGIYLPGKLGVRIEDLVLVTENGYEVLNKYNKELTIVE